jgi:hypothetical protein
MLNVKLLQRFDILQQNYIILVTSLSETSSEDEANTIQRKPSAGNFFQKNIAKLQPKTN